jgi:xylulokinase
MPLVLGVHSAMSSTKVELRDSDDGREYGSGRAAHPNAAPPVSEQDPMDWWHALVEARHDAGGALGVSSVAVAAQQHALVVLDQQGRVLRPAKLWNDTEAEPDAADLVDALGGPSEWAHATGSVPDASFAVAKLAWLRRREPDVFDRTAKVLLPHDWLTFRLSRKVVTDRGDASATGYWSPREERWLPEVLALIDPERDWDGQLPRVLAPDEQAGDREGVVISAGTGEAMAAALGVGLQPRDLMVSIEGSASVFTVRDRPTEDPSGAVAGFADATGRFMPLVRAPVGLDMTDAFARVLGVDATRFDQLALTGPSGAGGMTFVPGVAGGSGSLHHIASDVSSELIARAVVEGIACCLLDAIDALRSADVPVSGRLFLIGGGARGHAFQQVLADLSGRAIAVPKGDRIATGACVQATAALHGVPPEQVAQAWGLDRAREIEPSGRVDAEAIRAVYRAARDGDHRGGDVDDA